jgi:hypothetical protein
MTNKVFQNKFGSEGNCFAACVASITGLDLNKDLDIVIPEYGWEKIWINHLELHNKHLMIMNYRIEDGFTPPHFPRKTYVIAIGWNVHNTYRHAVVAEMETSDISEKTYETKIRIIHDPMGDESLSIENITQIAFFIE